MTEVCRRGLSAFAADFDVILCDVWGVVHNGVRSFRPAVEALRRFRSGGGTVILVTNAPAPAGQVRRRLDSLDVPADAYDAIVSSGDVTIELIVAAGCPPLLHIGPAGELALYEAAGRLGPRMPDLVPPEEAELAVCVGLDDARARPDDYRPVLDRLRARGLDLVCANPDLVVEVGDETVFCAGAIAALYAASGGKVVQAGKPFAPIYRRALALASELGGDVPEHRILAIGDAMRTDMQGAHDHGIAGFFITAGIHRAELHGAAGDQALDAATLERFLSGYGARPLAAAPTLAWG